MDEEIRELVMALEFEEYYNAQSDNVRGKFDYVMQIMKSQRVI